MANLNHFLRSQFAFFPTPWEAASLLHFQRAFAGGKKACLKNSFFMLKKSS
jgi:hypothetical protein